MKILIASKFLYARGGAEIYSINLGEMLQKRGYEVRFFSMCHPQNIHVNEDRYFTEEVSFFQSSMNGKLKAALRIFGAGVAQNFKKLLDEFQPDVVHLNNIHSYLSPIVAKLAYQRGVKVIWTLHDYKLICPSYSCLYKGNTCEACFTDKKHVVLRKCMKNSFPASILAWGEAMNWNKNKLSLWTNSFICPSQFMAEKMQQGGYPASKLQVISNFIGEEQVQYIINTPNPIREGAYAYIGRLSQEKGVESLLKAAFRLPYKLYIAGSGPLEADLKKKYTANNIIFLGHLGIMDTIELLKKISFTVIPSISYENNPLSVIESLCCGTPVLGRNIGGIPELIEISSYNHLFTQDKELPSLITKMFNTVVSANRDELSTTALQRFSGEHYYQKWLEIVGKE